MSRRHHKKSKNGCLECKRRHIRCDENHPICVNCGAAEIRCSFLDNGLPYIVESVSHGSSPFPTPSSMAMAATLSPPRPPLPDIQMSTQESFDSYSVNMTHLELFDNLSSKSFVSADDETQPDYMSLALFKRHAVTTPYLMHQLLAASALEMSIRTTRRDFYREFATGLQNRALELFNESHPTMKVTPANCVQMFLFSSLVAGHMLGDTLHYQRDSIEGFIDRFTHCLDVFRGVLTIFDQYWDMLLETELEAHLKWSRYGSHQTEGSGSECDILQNLSDAADTNPPSKKAYQEAVVHLQKCFDMHRSALGAQTRIHVVFRWPILVSPDFVELLRQRQPEALVILAHYAVLLHQARDMWLMGDGGRFLIDSICGCLGPGWQRWLELPTSALVDGET